jgi:hypothetical protein
VSVWRPGYLPILRTQAVSALADLICLLHQGRKGVIELTWICYPKLMNKETLCIGRHP